MRTYYVTLTISNTEAEQHLGFQARDFAEAMAIVAGIQAGALLSGFGCDVASLGGTKVRGRDYRWIGEEL